ncbi:dihydroneopterin aldolase [Ruminobacter sp. RM87]|uniref:dihydroneopterin aldolase n=1 Tax=Ruminobacter sp. RM87 TaxID=1200567 RepID=UPI0004E12C03|nr:dihydroneopterin aldolase [Ruminobacter sp. RM87]
MQSITNLKEHDTVIINGLVFSCIIGLLPEERVKEQRVIVNAELYTCFDRVSESDDIAHTVNYAEVADIIVSESVSCRAETVEFLGNRLIKALKERFAESLHGITLEVLKPDILKNVDSVGIRMTRMFKRDI